MADIVAKSKIERPKKSRESLFQGWGSDNPTFRQMFTSQLMPTATREQMDAFNETQRLSASPDCAFAD
jgi:hypothetical protein